MIPFGRHEIILETYRSSKNVSIEELLKITGCSATTIRGDLNPLFTQMINQNIWRWFGGPESKGNFVYA